MIILKVRILQRTNRGLPEWGGGDRQNERWGAGDTGFQLGNE